MWLQTKVIWFQGRNDNGLGKAAACLMFTGTHEYISLANAFGDPPSTRLQLITLPLPVCASASEICLLKRGTRVHKDGDVVIGGFFSLYNGFYWTGTTNLEPSKDFIILQLMPSSYQNVLALIFATEEINRNPQLLPNISLGYEFHNFLYSHWRVLESFLLLHTGQDETPNYTCGRESKSVAVLTGTAWATAAQIGTFLELYKFPQLTFGSFDPVLRENGQFPSLYQMAPKDTSLARGMVSLMLRFSWTWVGLVIAEGQKGLQFLSDVRAEMDRSSICVAFVKTISNSLVSYLSTTKLHDFLTRETSPVNVVIIYYDTDSLNDINHYVGRQLVTWRVWVTNSQWHVDMKGRNFILDPFHGVVIFSNHHKEISGFKSFIQTTTPSKFPEDVFLAVYWLRNFQCSLSDSDCTLEDCAPNASLAFLPANRFDTATNDGSYNVYNAVYAVALALHEVLLHRMHTQSVGNEEQMMVSPWKETVLVSLLISIFIVVSIHEEQGATADEQVEMTQDNLHFPEEGDVFQLHPLLKHIQFNNPVGDQVILNEKRKLDAKYDILNFWNFPEGLQFRVKVGEFSPRVPPGQQLSLCEELIEWATGITEIPHSVCTVSCNPGFRKAPQEGRPACCFDCTPCPENEIANHTDMDQCVKCPDHQYANAKQNHCLQKDVTFLAYEDSLGKALAATALSLSVLTILVLGLFVKHRNTPIVKAHNRGLSYTLLVSLTFCFLCSLLFIGRPNTATCVLRQTTFGIAFTVAVSTVLAKTITVVLAFKIAAPNRKMRQVLVSGAPNSIIPICSLIQLTLCGIWMGTSPPFIDTDAHSEHGHVIIVCNKGSLTAFYCVLGYLGSLALGSFTVAFLARNLPDTFNEAKYLTFSMLVFCSVWVTFLPVYHSTRGKAMVAMEVFSILASSAGLLGCIFAPKCYIILLKPDRNSLCGFKYKIHSVGNKTS